jgi:hypothetical protein
MNGGWFTGLLHCTALVDGNGKLKRALMLLNINITETLHQVLELKKAGM